MIRKYNIPINSGEVIFTKPTMTMQQNYWFPSPDYSMSRNEKIEKIFKIK